MIRPVASSFDAKPTRAAFKPAVVADQFVASKAEPPLLKAFATPVGTSAAADLIASEPGLQAAQKQALSANLALVNNIVLRRVADSGLRFIVVPDGSELASTGVLRNQEAAAYRAQLPQLQEFGSQLAVELQPLTQKIADLEKEFRSAPPSHQEALRPALDQARAEKYSAMAARVVASGAAVTVFSARPGRLLQGKNHHPVDPLQKASLDLLASNHGARTVQEKTLFFELTRSLNGARLEEAHREAVSEMRQSLAGHPRALQRQEGLAPEQIPLDLTKHTLVLPDLYFLHSPQGGATLQIDSSDLASVEGWQGGQGHVSPAQELEDPFNGQYFFLGGVNRVLLRSDVLASKTPIHELGHALDFLIEKQSPHFYGDWKDRLNHAYSAANQNSQNISNYSRANNREYLAEGFAYYHLKPAMLLDTDPQLHKLVGELIDQAAQHDPEIEKNLKQQFTTLPQQLGGARKFLSEKGSSGVEELQSVATSVRGRLTEQLAKTGRDACLQAASLGLLAGAVESLLLREAGHQPQPTLAEDPAQWLPALQTPTVDGSRVVSVTDQELQKASHSVRQSFDVAYQAGALGEFFIR